MSPRNQTFEQHLGPRVVVEVVVEVVEVLVEVVVDVVLVTDVVVFTSSFSCSGDWPCEANVKTAITTHAPDSPKHTQLKALYFEPDFTAIF